MSDTQTETLFDRLAGRAVEETVDELTDRLVREGRLSERPEPVKPEKVKCPECGKFYLPGVGIGVHLKAAHGKAGRTSMPKSKRGQTECPDCGKLIRKGDMARHRRIHTGEPAKRAPGRPPKNGAKAVTTVAPKEWTVDDIFASVVSILWPSGSVPVRVIAPLVEWREATKNMLEMLDLLGASGDA